jgi:tRNA(fMet)-specific endonuclease VapC
MDTDHMTVLQNAVDPRNPRLQNRLRTALASEEIATTIVTVEEHMQGWLARLRSERDLHQLVIWYEKLFGLLGFFQSWKIALFDAASVQQFQELRRDRIRIGTQDLKIASIALSRDALLLTANARDFSRVPGLRIEDWLN